MTLDPDLADTHIALGIVKLQYDWDWEGAKTRARSRSRAEPGRPAGDALARALAGGDERAAAPRWSTSRVPSDPDSARRLLAEADDLREQSYIPAAALVLAAMVARDTDSLFRWLDAAYDERSVQLPYLLRNPALPLSDPRVVALVRRMKLPTHS